jgi:hypothetical protein
VVDFIAAHASPLFPTPPTVELTRSQMMEMFESGVDLGSDFRLRRLPLWNDRIRHGSTTIQLGKSIGLAAAARARRNRSELALATRQLEWVLGANPFSRSLVFGVGNDWWQNFAVELSNFVGGLSLGFNSYSGDSPAWGNNAVFPYKEQWVYASSRLAMMLSTVGMPARMRGNAPLGATLVHERTGVTIELPPGDFDVSIPAGKYSASFGTNTRTVTLGESSVCSADFDPEHWIDLELSSHAAAVLVRATGRGKHVVSFRANNVANVPSPWNVTLTSDTATFSVPLDVIDACRPWHLFAVPDELVADSVEVGGPKPASLS